MFYFYILETIVFSVVLCSKYKMIGIFIFIYVHGNSIPCSATESTSIINRYFTR